MCCFTLSIFVDQRFEAEYKTESSTSPKGEYSYLLEGTAYGLATLNPSEGAHQTVYSTEGGVAAGFADELNHVTFEGEPFGCPPDKPQGVFENLDFRRTAHDDPIYKPPGFGVTLGSMEFGPPFGAGSLFGPECSQFADEVGSETGLVLRTHGNPQARFLNGLSEGPIIGSGLTVGGLLKGEHEKQITCFQLGAAETKSPPREFTSRVAMIIDIVHYSPDDRKRLVRKLRSYIGQKPPEENAASHLLDKYYNAPGHERANGCTSSS